MDPVAITELLTKYGLIAAVVLCVYSMRWIFLKFEASQQARIDDGKLYAGALKDAAKAIEKSNEANVDLAAEVGRLKLMIEHSRGGS